MSDTIKSQTSEEPSTPRIVFFFSLYSAVCLRKETLQVSVLPEGSIPGGDSLYERGGDARRNFWIKPLKETDLGVAQAFFHP